MGRPKLGETALRRHVVTVRLNDGEHEELRRQAGRRGCGCRSSSASGCRSGGFRSAARGNWGRPSFGS